MEIDNLLENISIVSNDTINTIELKEFPKEGCCKTNRIELRDYLKNKFSQHLQKSWRSYYNIVAWNEIEYWFCEEKSSKPEYQLSQLQKFFAKEEVGQPLLRAVHCKTQEEWDFVSDKLGYKFINKFELGNSDTINPVSKGCQSKSFFEGHEEYQILSFQEWCDLNGYKMETNIDLTGRHLRALIDGPQSTIYKKGDIVDIFKKESSNQYRIGKVGDGWWTYTTNNGTESQWELLPEDYKMEKKAKFEVGDYVVLENAGGWSYSTCNDGCLGLITKIGNFKPSTVTDYICSISGNILNSNNKDTTFRDIPIAFYNRKWIVRHATPEEINNHLISIGQIPAGEPLNTGIEPNKDGMFRCSSTTGSPWTGLTPTNHLGAMYQGDIMGKPIKLKMILSIDDEELPMVPIIKTNSIKQLLNND